MRLLQIIVILGMAGCTTVEPLPPPVEKVAEAEPVYSVPAGRLARSVIPLHYQLELTIVPTREGFSGTTWIDIDIREPVDRIFLHGLGLEVSAVSLKLGQHILEGSYTEVDPTGVAMLDFAQTLQPQRAQLQLSYRAAFGKQLTGLYRVLDAGRWYAFSQFEPLSAREAFPSFDEPSFKAPFDITVNSIEGHTVISSSPAYERVPYGKGLQQVRFETTPPLPTYLIAFAVGPLDVVTAAPIPSNRVRDRPLPLRAAAARGKGERLYHALGTTGPLLQWQEAYFDFPYPFAKLDLIAVPDFAAGAMENVGAITYRESLLLLGDNAPAAQRRRHAAVHAHELAHQWFGNLVTMPWWDDIWLNEAFATWMAYKTVAAWDPSHQPELRRLRRLKLAMAEDALATARQVRQPVIDHHDVENAFDGITYSKGGAVLSMVERYMGETAFRDAIRLHMKRHAFGNADVNDLMASLSAIGGEQVATAMHSFIFQPGIPLLEVSLDCSRRPAAIEVRQSRFTPVGSPADAAQLWSVPMCFSYGDDDHRYEQCAMVEDVAEHIVVDKMRCPKWILPNAGFAGYYHWTLPGDTYTPLLRNPEQLQAAELMSVADSLYASLAGGLITIADAARGFGRLARSPWPEVALSPRDFILDTAAVLATDPATANGVRRYARSLYGGILAAEAFDILAMSSLPTDSQRLYLVEVAEILAWAGDTEVGNAAQRGAGQWLRGREDALPPESVELGLQLALEQQPELFELAVERLIESRDGQQRRTLLRALAKANLPEQAPRLYALMLTDSVRVGEVRAFFLTHIENPQMRRPAWTWIQRNAEPLLAKLPPRDAGRLPAEVAASLCDRDAIESVEAFLDQVSGDFIGAPRNTAKALEAIRLCAARRELQAPQAASYFR